MTLQEMDEVVLFRFWDAPVDVEDVGDMMLLAVRDRDTFREGTPTIKDDDVIVLRLFEILEDLTRVIVHATED